MARHKILTEKEVSEWLGIPEATLKTQRFRKKDSMSAQLAFKLPNGKIAYREDQVNEWIERQSMAVKPPTRRTG
jgi:predicted DNA-binding transcriptional regulator AlpA